jgi:organic radical activating enzyme
VEDPKASLVEIFSAIQGEGPRVGERQLFLRFLGCDVHCAFCDTPATHQQVRDARAERTPGARDWAPLANPAPLAAVLDATARLHAPGLHKMVTLTGGEPLLQDRFLARFLPALRARVPLPVYCETHGLAPDALARLIDHVDLVAMDVKLPSATGEPARFDEHRAFLAIARRRAHFVKMVVGPATPREELLAACDLVAEVDPATPVVLQPATPYGAIKRAPAPGLMLALQAAAATRLSDVRVIPQTHVYMGQL